LIIYFASQRTLGNFVAGLMIATTQPLRLGDWVEVGGVAGAVEEIGLMYTFIRTEDNARLVIPNEKLASDTIRNSTIRSAAKYAEVTVQVPLTADLRSLVEALRNEVPGERDEVFVSSLEGSPALTVRAWAESEPAAQQLERDLRLRVHSRLCELGIYA
jgi:small conductance mechanosensitive channel